MDNTLVVYENRKSISFKIDKELNIVIKCPKGIKEKELLKILKGENKPYTKVKALYDKVLKEREELLILKERNEIFVLGKIFKKEVVRNGSKRNYVEIDFLNEVIYQGINKLESWNFSKYFKMEVEKYLKEFYNIFIEKLKATNSYIFKDVACVKIKVLKGRWGSCSSRNEITLSTYLFSCRKEVIEYVIYHELCHTLEKNHQRNFKDLIKNRYKDYRVYDKYLNVNSRKLMFWE